MISVHRDGTELYSRGARTAPQRLVRGEVSLWRAGRLLGYRSAPAVLGLSPVEVRAEGEVELARLGPDELVEAREAEIDGWVRALEDRVVALDEFWADEPGARLVPGPYEFGPFRATLLVVQGPPGHVRSLLPPGLHPVVGLGDRYLMVLAELERVRSIHRTSPGERWRYRELTPLLPCWFERGAPGAFVPELYPDAVLPTLLGREIYGFPKRVARIDSGADRFDVMVEHRRVLRARWGEREASDPGDLVRSVSGALAPVLPRWIREGLGRLAGRGGGPTMPVYVRDQQLHRSKLRNRALRTDALVRIPFAFDAITEVERVQADVRFEPGHRILAGEVLQAWSVRTGFRFGKSAVARDLRLSVRARWEARCGS